MAMREDTGEVRRSLDLGTDAPRLMDLPLKGDGGGTPADGMSEGPLIRGLDGKPAVRTVRLDGGRLTLEPVSLAAARATTTLPGTTPAGAGRLYGFWRVLDDNARGWCIELRVYRICRGRGSCRRSEAWGRSPVQMH